MAWTLSVILDYADEMIVRKTGKTSHFGCLLDMLSNRLRLLALIIAWWQVEMTLIADMLSGFVVIMFVSMNVITHVFVRHGEPISDKAFFWQRPLARVFLEFNMHTFFVLGACFAIGRGIEKLSLLWLSLILLLSFTIELDNRLIRDGRLSVKINHKLLNFIKSGK